MTIIELITVLLLLGVLSAIATKAMVRSKSRALAAAVESDLRNLAVAQENYFAGRSSYFGGGGGVSFASSPAFEYNPTPGVSLEVRAGDGGWAARAVHEKLVDRDHACSIYFGQVEPYPPAVREGVVTCRPNMSGQGDGNDGGGGNDGGKGSKKDKKDKKDNNKGNKDGDKGNNGNGNNDGKGNGNQDDKRGGNNDGKGNGNNGNGNDGRAGSGKKGKKDDGATGDGTGGSGNKDSSGKKDGKNDSEKGNGKGNGG
jgi:Tfp pilus assembly protein PilE